MVDYYTKYGITENEYQELLKEQNYSCAICGRNQSRFRCRLAVEHQHCIGYDKLCPEEKKRRVRGLCCNFCNRGLKLFNDSPERLHNAGDYLRKFYDRFNNREELLQQDLLIK